MKSENQYDVIIIGSSYAGLSAGMTLGRALLKVLIIDSENPCNKQTPHSHNFLTNDGKTPNEIACLSKQQVSMYGTVSFLNAFVMTASKTGKSFEVQVQSGKKLSARKLIFATGIKDIMPNIPGFTESWGIGVLHCPYCHGYEVRHQKTGILANGDIAFDMASLISNWTADLSLYTNGKSTLTNGQKEKLQKHKINVTETEIKRLEHKNGFIENIVFKDGREVPLKALYARLPLAAFFRTSGVRMRNHY